MGKKLREQNDLIFRDKKAAHDFFEELCQLDIWQTVNTRELLTVPLDNIPILLDHVRSTKNIALEVSDESLKECMDDWGLCLRIPFSNGNKCYPLGDTSYNSLMQRAGFQTSSVLSNSKDKSHQKTMSPEEKSIILNMGLNCFNNKALALIRDEKVRAVLSGDSSDYSILPFDDLIYAFLDELKVQFKEVTFIHASASHTLFTYLVNMHDPKIESTLKEIFNNSGYYASDLTLGCMLSSSDVGLSGANIYPYIYSDGSYRLFSQPLCLTHKNNHSIQDFKDNAAKVFSLFKDLEKNLDEMATKKLRHPKGALLRICKHIGLPKKISCEMAVQFESMFSSPTQLDLHWMLYEILARHEADSKQSLSSSSKITYEENIARITIGNISSFDIPFEWE